MLQEGDIDLSRLPRDYLESYPYPAFVLVVPIPPKTNTDESDDFPSPSVDRAPPFTRASHSRLQPFDVVWSNKKWRNLTQGRALLECLSTKAARELGDWISEARDLEEFVEAKSPTGNGSSQTITGFPNFSFAHSLDRRDPSDTPRATLNRSHSGASGARSPLLSPPAGFWEVEKPYEDRAMHSDGVLVSDVESTGLEGVNGDHPGPPTLVLELIRPGKVTLEMTKTTMSVWRSGSSGMQSQMNTHSFAIITTTPRSALIPNGATNDIHNEILSIAPPTEPPIRPSLEHNSSTPKAIPLASSASRSISQPNAATGKSNPQVDGSSNSAHGGVSQSRMDRVGDTVSQPLVFNRDGEVVKPKPKVTGTHPDGTSMDVEVLMETTDWTQTSLGARETWPQSLKTTVGLVLKYPHACCLWWGSDLTLIYNEQYAQTVGKHPHLFGMSGPEAWAEIWAALGPISKVVLSGTPVWKEDDFLLFRQSLKGEQVTHEEYHTWLWVPVVQEDGTVGGLWNATIATTSKVLTERRLAAVREMGQRTSIARTMEEFDAAVIEILTASAKDAPFAALYHVEPATVKKPKDGLNSAQITKNDQSDAVKVNVRLAGAIGIPDGHPSTPSHFSLTLRDRSRSNAAAFAQGGVAGSPTLSMTSSLSSAVPAISLTDSNTSQSDQMLQWPIRDALQAGRMIMVEDCSSLIQDFPIRVWDELPNAAVIVPINNDSDDGIPSAVLVLGLNIRRPFDEDYESFIRILQEDHTLKRLIRLRLQLASGIAAVRSYEAERQRIDELAALDRAKSMLFSNVSHELRTPLTLVSGPLDDLLLETKDGPKKEMLLMARRNVRRLTRLVSTLMDVSRLEAGRLRGSFSPVNLGILTEDLTDLFRAAIERAGLKYIVECDRSYRNVYVDKEHWEKIIFNLIGNAMKYTMKGYVRVNLAYSQNEAILEVKDSGVGIPASDINLVGERFHRVQSVSRSHEGTGIGLALIKELIKLHGGVLEIDSLTPQESSDGSHGSTFRVRIPLGLDHLPSDSIETGTIENIAKSTYGQGLVDEAMQWTRDREGTGSVVSSDESGGTGVISSSESTGHSSRGLDPSTLYFEKADVIMIVDDSNDTRRYLHTIFAQYCTIVEARDGVEALQLCKKQLPNLIITDVMMPNLDGFGLLAALKESRAMKVIPVIMLTARGGDESKVEGILAGADDYLAKPFNAREIVARAHMQLQLGKKRKHLEDAFEARTAELRAITECEATEVGDVTFANSAWYEIAGYPFDQPVTNWVDYIVEHDQKAIMLFWQDVLTSDQVMQSADWSYKNGRWANVKVIRLDLIQSGLKGVLGCVTDITERKMHEQSQRLRVAEAEQRRLEAEEAKRQQELLIDITSHEIRNPISSLMQISHFLTCFILTLTCFCLLYCSSLVKTNLLSLQEQLELVIDQQKPFVPTRQLLNNIDEDLEALESIYQCGLAQERISNDVLSLGRIQLDMLQMFDVEVDMQKEAQKVVSIFQNEARMKRIALSVKWGDGIGRLGTSMIKTDPVRLNQVVTNLLSNAIRFTSTSDVRQIELQADVSLEPPAGPNCVPPPHPSQKPADLKDDMPIYLYIGVKDSGPGMSSAELELLFQRFSQVSPKTHTIFGGSGLGLFVCRKITEIMGGRIDVISEKGEGSTFRFYIEARTCQISTKPDTDDLGTGTKTKKGGKVRASPKNRDMAKFFGMSRKPHVLIVEDNLINQTVLARQLKHCNLTCDVANNGLEALEKIRGASSLERSSKVQPFDCVLMDLEMPVMDGLTAVRHIREEEAAGKLADNLIIALTGNARQGQIDEAKASGMDEVVIKPYRLDDLLQKIEDMMKIRAKQEETVEAD
nr:uncharacterized protein CI109_000662 [Kwoniella shandongensis]KAA5531090.1 hypothetical protein CI109_000662 [Kwoniella shandongensis]